MAIDAIFMRGYKQAESFIHDFSNQINVDMIQKEIKANLQTAFIAGENKQWTTFKVNYNAAKELYEALEWTVTKVDAEIRPTIDQEMVNKLLWLKQFADKH